MRAVPSVGYIVRYVGGSSRPLEHTLHLWVVPFVHGTEPGDEDGVVSLVLRSFGEVRAAAVVLQPRCCAIHA